jgi:pimeloyl-ACP methyl ester carboxylesterase
MQSVPSSTGVDLAVHDLGGVGPTVLLTHATGFHGRAYREFASRLADRFHIIAPDDRGHGDSPEATDQTKLWEQSGRDIVALAETLDELGGPLFGFGHSKGGTSLLLAEHLRPGTFTAIVVFEPVIFPEVQARIAAEFEKGLIAATRRRRTEFASTAEAVANFAAKRPLDCLTSQALHDYVAFGTRPTAHGRVELKCRPDYEAETFAQGSQHRVFDVLPTVACPVLVLSGDMSRPGPGALASNHAERLGNGSFHEFPALNHFGPLQDPDTIAAITRDFYGRFTQ